MFEGLLFYPTLGFNLLRNYLQPEKWAWYSRIDDFIVLGALPFRSMVKELIEKESIGGVVCCTEGILVSSFLQKFVLWNTVIL